jgi:hypothetical protein
MTIAKQTVSELGGSLSVLALQRRDHMKLDAMLHQLGGTMPSEQDAILRRICRRVFSHAFAEEAVLWPLIRSRVPDGEQLTLRVEQEHQQINELVATLECAQPGSAEHQKLLSEVIRLLRQDVRDEEDELLAKLQSRSSPARLRLVGMAWYAVRKIAPTRAHPVVSRRPPGNVLSAVPLSLVDRLRDAVDAALQRVFPPASALRRLSAKLAAVSHATEVIPFFRSGEHPATRRESPLGRKMVVNCGLRGALMVAGLSMAYRRRHATPWI